MLHNLAVRDYAEASKCFIQTLRLDPNNYPAMRDLANLQIHERNLDGFLETRRHILKARSRFIREWAAFAMANHLVISVHLQLHSDPVRLNSLKH